MDTWPTALTMAERSTTTPEYCCMKRDFSAGSPSSIGVPSDVPAPNRLSFESVESVLSRRNAPQPRGYGQGRDRTGDLPLFSYVVPAGDARTCGKIGCGRSPRSSFLGAGEPFFSLIRGAGSGAAHCCHEHKGPALFIPVRILWATASL